MSLIFAHLNHLAFSHNISIVFEFSDRSRQSLSFLIFISKTTCFLSLCTYKSFNLLVVVAVEPGQFAITIPFFSWRSRKAL
jgi:hypothetical protein